MRNLVLVAFLVLALFSNIGCHKDKEIIDKHEQALEEEGEE
jgi:hypothetical protein